MAPRAMALGTHLIIDAHACDHPDLGDVEALERLLVTAADECGADVVGKANRHYRKKRGGVTLGVLLNLGNSHATLHTFPDERRWLADILIIGRGKPQEALRVLRTTLGGIVNTTVLERG